MKMNTMTTQTTMCLALKTITISSRPKFTKRSQGIPVRSAEAQATVGTMATTIIDIEKWVCGERPIVSACFSEAYIA